MVQKKQAGVEAILGARWYNGIYQYEVRMEKKRKPMWKDADKLECYDLIDQFEVNHEV